MDATVRPSVERIDVTIRPAELLAWISQELGRDVRSYDVRGAFVGGGSLVFLHLEAPPGP
jgi:hypothetical protein